ncbi:oligosaccharide flippase family protein [Halomarina ordinaria]|uniref:Oligosaccharide flippase family protein n=1 Tax=Halomarina ordinaria TaxID=3033939 RepID=A0ABD5U3Q1_9EURY|nr:oligosaccharide flippase family protein [Halomarina sp. PSRA2]
MSLASKVSGDILVTTLFKLSLKVRGLVLIPLLTVALGVGDYGAYVQVNAIATVLSLVCLLGLDAGYVKYIHETGRPAGLFTAVTLLGGGVAALGGGALALAADPLARYTLQSASYAPLFVLGGGYVLVHTLFTLGRSHYRATRRVKRFSAIEAVDVYLSVGAVAAVVFVVEGTIVGVLLATLSVHACLTLLTYGAIAVEGGLAWPSTDQLHECVRFSLGAMGSTVSSSLLHRVDRVLVGYFLGASAVGVYSVAYSVAYLMRLYFLPVTTSFFPEFSKLWAEGDHATIRRFLNSGVRYAATFGLPSIAGFALVGSDLIGLLSTPAVAREGALALVLVAAGLFCMGLGEFYTNLFYAAGDSRVPLVVQGGTVLANVLLNWWAIPALGVAGAAATTLVTFGASVLVLGVAFQSHLRVVPDWSRLGRVVVATLAMYAAFAVVSPPWLVTLAAAPVGYFAVLFAVGGVERTDVRVVVDAVR